MKNLLIGLLMLVTTNVMAAEKKEVPQYPIHELKVSTQCEKGKYYVIHSSKGFASAELIYELHKELNIWLPMKCTGA